MSNFDPFTFTPKHRKKPKNTLKGGPNWFDLTFKDEFHINENH